MAVCTWCHREMTDRVSCTVSVLRFAGDPHRLSRTRELCHDCAAPPGGLHHIGCDMQRCRRCHGQLMCCGCIFDEDIDDPVPGDFVGDVVSTELYLDREAVWEPLQFVARAARRDP